MSNDYVMQFEAMLKIKFVLQQFRPTLKQVDVPIRRNKAGRLFN
jgi:hypothetical protein